MPQLGLDGLRAGARNHPRKRVGRGPGSGHGKTSGKGHKGQKARSGGVKGPAFEGGQTPLQRRLPKRGFTNAAFAHHWRVLNVGRLAGLPADSDVDAAALVAAGLLPDGPEPLKVLGGGELAIRLTVRAHAFSEAARQKILASGGQAEIVGAAGTKA